jgi:hypothetical protein
MVTRVQRAWVYALLVLLVVPGLIGFDVWPLTGWRLFSLSRDASQIEWALDVRVDGTNTFREIDLEELPLAFRNAAWPLAELSGASDARRHAVCEALLDGVRDAEPDAVELALVRERRTMTVEGIEEEREVMAQCIA